MCCTCGIAIIEQAPVVQKVDNTICQINHYPLDSALLVSLTLIRWIVIYPVDSAIHGLLLNNWDLEIRIAGYSGHGRLQSQPKFTSVSFI